MRKRDREAMKKFVSEKNVQLQYAAVSQLSGSEWYFEANSEMKGFSFAFSAARNAMWIGHDLLKQLHRKSGSSGFLSETDMERLKEEFQTADKAQLVELQKELKKLLKNAPST